MKINKKSDNITELIAANLGGQLRDDWTLVTKTELVVANLAGQLRDDY